MSEQGSHSKFRPHRLFKLSERKKISRQKIVIDYLYLDLNTCDRCIGTDQVLEEVIHVISPAFQIAGYDILYNKVEMETEPIAIRNEFVSSPTIRVNGQDICLSVKESSCGCCSDISGTPVDCRVFEFEGRDFDVPPKEMIATAIFEAVFSGVERETEKDVYHLPDNLKTFYAGKQKKMVLPEDSCC